MSKNKDFNKNFIWNIIGTTFNAFNSLFFLVIVTRINGTNDAGIFTFAFSTACVLYIIGIYAGRIFQVTEKEEINDKEYIVNRISTTIIMILVSIAFVIIKGYDIYKAEIFIIICLYKALEAFSDVIYGILQKNDLLHKVGKSFFAKALISIILFIIVELLTKNLIIASLMIVISNFIVIVFYDILNVKNIIKKEEKIKIKNVLRIYKTGFFIFAITFLGLYVMNAPKYAIDDYLSENIQAIFGIIIMPATVVGLFSQFIIHPYLNIIVDLYKDKKINEIKKIMKNIIIAIIIFGAICVAGAYLLGIPVLELIYGIELKAYKTNLLLIILASTLYVVGTIYSSILTTMRKTFVQFTIYCFVSIFAIIVSYILTRNFEINGATVAYFSIMTIQFILYCICTTKILNKETLKEEKDENKSISSNTGI
ncbi:MAG: hypothetical protein HUJ68_08815 [Clostridia bacterium]|nr:hypothetical protein [Clostridia bacterium]